MNPSRGDLHGLMVEAGRSAAPPPRPEFVESLRAHLVDLWPDRATPALQPARLSRRELRRVLSEVGAAPVPSSAPVETMKEDLRRNWAPAGSEPATARKSIRARYAAAAAAALVGAVWLGGQALTNQDASTVASGEAVSINRHGKQKLGADELDGRYLEDGEKVRVNAEGAYVVRVNGTWYPISRDVAYADGVVVVDDTPIAVEQPSGGDTQTAAGLEGPRIEQAPGETTTTTTTEPPSTTTTVPPSSTTSTTTPPAAP